MTKLVERCVVVDLLEYQPLTGQFRWKKCPQNRWSGNEFAGSKTKDGYQIICIKGKKYLSHRLAWFWVYGSWPEGQIDHINHDRLDNRIENLRVVTLQENRKNQRLSKANTSGQIGVHWATRDKRWRAAIQVKGKMMGLGDYKTFKEAVEARKAAEVKYNFHPNHGI